MESEEGKALNVDIGDMSSLPFSYKQTTMTVICHTLCLFISPPLPHLTQLCYQLSCELRASHRRKHRGGRGRVPPEFVVGERQCYSSPPDFGQLDMLCNESLSSAEVPGLTYSSVSSPAHRLVPSCEMTRIIALCRCARTPL